MEMVRVGKALHQGDINTALGIVRNNDFSDGDITQCDTYKEDRQALDFSGKCNR